MVGAIQNSPRRFTASLARASCFVLCGFAADLAFAFYELGLRLEVQVLLGTLVGFALLGTCAIPVLALSAWLGPRASAAAARALAATDDDLLAFYGSGFKRPFFHWGTMAAALTHRSARRWRRRSMVLMMRRPPRSRTVHVSVSSPHSCA